MPEGERRGSQQREVARDGRRARVLVRRLAWALTLALLAQAGQAGGVPITNEIAGVRVTVHSPWPDGLLPGWMPCTASFTNSTAEAVTVTSTASQDMMWRSQATSLVRLQPGETHRVQWLVPIHAAQGTGLNLLVRASGDYATFVLSSTLGNNTLDDEFTLIALAPGEAAPDWPGTTTPRQHWVASTQIVRHDDLPTDWRAYTSLARLLLSTAEGPPEAAVVDALLAWVAAGGVLQVVGDTRGLQLPLDERFRSPDRFGHPDLISEHRHGFGWIQQARIGRPDVTLNWNEERVDPSRYAHLPTFVRRQFAPVVPTEQESAAPGTFPMWLSSVDTSIPGLAAIPLAMLATILVIFYIVMGPVQFTVIKRTKARPATMLWSTPLLGFGFAAMLVGASVLQQGLSVRDVVTSITWLDQPRHHAASVALRTVFSGSVFDTALRFDAGSAVVSRAHSSTDEASHHVDLDRNVLSGSFLPVRAPVTETLVRSTRARQRIAIERQGDQLHVVNALGVEVLDLWYHDDDGVAWQLTEGTLPDGERRALQVGQPRKGTIQLTSPLEPITDIASLRHIGKPAWPALGNYPDQARRRCYVALLADSPFLDDGGVARETIASRHVLFGDLGPEP